MVRISPKRRGSKSPVKRSRKRSSRRSRSIKRSRLIRNSKRRSRIRSKSPRKYRPIFRSIRHSRNMNGYSPSISLPQNTWKLYTKNGCPYCAKAKQLLTDKGQKYTEIEVTQENKESTFAKLDSLTGKYRYFPMIFKNEKFIGGYSDLEKNL